MAGNTPSKGATARKNGRHGHLCPAPTADSGRLRRRGRGPGRWPYHLCPDSSDIATPTGALRDTYLSAVRPCMASSRPGIRRVMTRVPLGTDGPVGGRGRVTFRGPTGPGARFQGLTAMLGQSRGWSGAVRPLGSAGGPCKPVFLAWSLRTNRRTGTSVATSSSTTSTQSDSS